ncbi:ADP-ribosylation factor GTPase-activating protein [Vairimorpha necatrix]|uniref:ADP-ribosylation factor GTPase-activating protein n=1 Tax=Vairimorpha necatrix TaxID=6039 RepID=A0AAX4J8S0_9MICR
MTDKFVNEDTYNKQISNLLHVSGNNTCIDCNIPNTQWASKTYGIFLCFDCTSTHRSLGVNLSFVKSINMDKWNKMEYLFMELGGNDKFREMINKHNLQDKESNVLYFEPVVKKYGERLKASVFEKLGLDEEEYNSAQNKRKVKRDRIYEPKRHIKEETPNTFYDKLSEISSTFFSGVKGVKNKTLEYGEKFGRNVIIPSAMIIKSQTMSWATSLKSAPKKEKEHFQYEDEEIEDFSKWE